MGKSNRRKKEKAEKKRRRRKRTYSRELNELSEGVTTTVKPTRKSHSTPSSQKNILPQSPGRGNIKCSNNKSEAVGLWEPNLDATSSKITSVSNKTNVNHQNYLMSLNTSSGHPKRPCTSFDTVKLKSSKIISNTADRKRQPFLNIKEELRIRPLIPLRQSKKQKPETTAMPQTATALLAFGDRESTAHKADRKRQPFSNINEELRIRPIVPLHQSKKQKTETTAIHGHDITLSPYIKLMEVTNSTAGTRKTK
ncbi:uncharacterized protein LOC142101548 [Mixophyes fleayi]|uniref:uncharacterized protein LOC142101548 n=1 Tax=Mixophyes fleayi TaxID=3061075 RepID=UPI003F4DAEDD